MQHQSSSNVAGGAPSRARFLLRLGAGLASLLGALGVLAIGCGGGAPPPGVPCENGVIRNGVCEGICTPDQCVANNTCVNNRCKLNCDAHSDCTGGNQDCTAAVADDKVDVHVCTSNGKAPFGVKCPLGFECDGLFACPDGSACDYNQCGGGECTRNHEECGNDPKCLVGRCPDDSPCTISGCSQAECKPMTCITAGEGDAKAFCSIINCHADTDCPGGYVCGVGRDPHGICNSDIEGDNVACGKTDDPCIDPADFNKDGATYFAGALCLLRMQCNKRGPCDPCESDYDCSYNPGHHCREVVGTKVCTQDCFIDKDCNPDYKCVENACVPRFEGGCQGTGQFCEPCQDDADCGEGSYCEHGTGDERGCLSIDAPACAASADCPTAPSGQHGACLTSGTCYLPFDGKKLGCW